MTSFELGLLFGLVFYAGIVYCTRGSLLPRRRRGGLRQCLRRTLVVHTKDGRSFRGLLAAEHRDCVVLEQAEWLDEGVTVARAVVLLSNISWAQDVTGFARPDATDQAPSERFEVTRDEVK